MKQLHSHGNWWVRHVVRPIQNWINQIKNRKTQGSLGIPSVPVCCPHEPKETEKALDALANQLCNERK